MLRYKIFYVLLLITSMSFRQGYSQSEYNVLDKWMTYSDKSNYSYHYFSEKALTHLEKRDNELKNIMHINELKKKQNEMRIVLSDIVGPFPDKSSLEPLVVNKVDKQGYFFENIIFQSQPGFYVTGTIFMPNDLGENKAPAILYCSGHTNNVPAFGNHAYQISIINLVKKGFIVFAFDPIGQGERFQYLDSTHNPIALATTDHSYSGAAGFLLNGSKQAMQMIWDGIRAIDYLYTRSEVDTNRIGITGRSGGGTQASYIAAFDDRIDAAAPEAFISSYSKYIESFWSGGDAERYFRNSIKRGFSHTDLMLVRAPKPTIMIATTEDEFFPIQGFRESFYDMKRIYKLFEKEDYLLSSEDCGTHVSTRKNREAMYSFFQEYLSNPGNPQEEDIEFLSNEELFSTENGRLYLTEKNAKTIFDLNKSEIEEYEMVNDSIRGDLSNYLNSAVEKAKYLSGFNKDSMFIEPVFDGRIRVPEFDIEKYYIRGESKFDLIPYLLLLPKNSNGKAIIDINPLGKAQEIKSQKIKFFIDEGYTILIPDLMGIGELADGRMNLPKVELLNDKSKYAQVADKTFYRNWYLSILTGESFVGIQSKQISRLVDILKSQGFNEVYGFAKGLSCETLLHVAAFDERLKRIFLYEPLISYRSIFNNFYYDPNYVYGFVPGALEFYDLPDLSASLSPRKLTIVNPKNGDGDFIVNSNQKEINIINKIYKEGRLNIVLNDFNAKDIDLLLEWLK